MLHSGHVSGKFRILIADDHPVVAGAIAKAIETVENFRVIDTVTNSCRLFDALQTGGPDVLITDFSMPGGGRDWGGFPMINKILREFASVRVIVFTGVMGPPTLQALFSGNAHGVVTKADSLDEVFAALSAVTVGSTYRSKILERIVLKRSINMQNGVRLTSKEAEVIRLFVGGMTVIEIASLFRKSIKTISNQKWAAMRKFGCESDAQLYEFYQFGGFASVHLDAE